MSQDLEALSSMEYPGRFIILGQNPEGKNVAIYGITGRSQSSQARKLTAQGLTVTVEPTDSSLLQTGNPALLIYDALQVLSRGVAVSNGEHTNSISGELRTLNYNSPELILAHSLHNWSYEPDSNKTPRIAGCIMKDNAALGIIKDSESSVMRGYFEFPLIPGRGKLISTYTGEDLSLLPSFSGEPLQIQFNFSSAEKIAEIVYETLAPKSGSDLRVSVASVVYNPNDKRKVDIFIKNRHESK